MNLLGDVNNGWFAQLAHGVEGAGSWVGDKVGGVFGNSNAGTNFYNTMGNQANQVVSNINQNAINQATAAGATPQQALNAGSAAMEPLINPQNASDLANLTSVGAQTAGNTVAQTVQNALTPDLGGLMMGALAVGGALLACEMFTSSPSTPASSRRERNRECEAC